MKNRIMENNNEPFHELPLSAKITVVIGISLLILFALGFVYGLFFFGFVGFFQLFGVEYESVGSLLLFVLCFIILELMVDIIRRVVVKIVSVYMTGKYKISLINTVMDALFTWLIIFTVDEFMQQVTILCTTEIIAAGILALAEYVFDNKK